MNNGNIPILIVYADFHNFGVYLINLSNMEYPLRDPIASFKHQNCDFQFGFQEIRRKEWQNSNEKAYYSSKIVDS